MSEPSTDVAAPEQASSPLAEELRARLGDLLLEATDDRGQLIIRVAAADRPRALATLKTMGFTYYVFCCGVDWPDDGKFEVFDHVYSIAQRARVTVKCDVPRDEPRLPTGTTVYAGADWHERETWELFGIVFVGHPRLRRLLLPDWQDGFPMRKDYVLRAREEKPWPGDFFSG